MEGVVRLTHPPSRAADFVGVPRVTQEPNGYFGCKDRRHGPNGYVGKKRPLNIMQDEVDHGVANFS